MYIKNSNGVRILHERIKCTVLCDTAYFRHGIGEEVDGCT